MNTQYKKNLKMVLEKSKEYTDCLYTLATNNKAGDDTEANILAKTSDSGIWVGSDTGHWYYWDGTQYVDGGVYNAVICDKDLSLTSSNALENKIISYLNTSSKLVTIITPVWSAWDNYIQGSGIVSNSGAGNIAYTTKAIQLLKGDTIIFQAQGYAPAGVVLLAKIIGVNTFDPIITSTDNDKHMLTYTAPYDMEVAICSYQVLDYNYFYIVKNLNEYMGIKVLNKNDLTWHNNQYLLNNGEYSGVVDLSGWFYSYPIYIKRGTKITFKGKGYLTNVSMVSRLNINNWSYINVSGSLDGIEQYTYTTDCDGYYVFCTEMNYDLSITLTPTNNEIVKYINLSLFETMGIIGDSYATGELVYDNQYVDKVKISWGQQIARKNGITCKNYSWGGLTTRSWLIDPKNILLNDDPLNLYILALGINDTLSLGTSYIGSESDINDSDYNLNADTFYGNYGKIIAIIKEHAPNCKLVISTMANNTGDFALFNNAIIGIANHFQIPCIKQYDHEYFKSSFYNNRMVGGHPIAINYSGMAGAIEDLIKNSMVEYYNYFANYYMY